MWTAKLILSKIIKIVGTSCKAEMHQLRFWLGLHPRPHRGAFSAPPDLQMDFREPTSKGRGGRGKKGRGRGRESERGERRERESVPTPFYGVPPVGCGWWRGWSLHGLGPRLTGDGLDPPLLQHTLSVSHTASAPKVHSTETELQFNSYRNHRNAILTNCWIVVVEESMVDKLHRERWNIRRITNQNETLQVVHCR